MEIQQAIQSIIKKYQLGVKDVFASPEGWKMITSDGIRRMIWVENIDISKHLMHLSPDGKIAVVQCTAYWQENDKNRRAYEALGECAPDNNQFSYPVNVAEKRAESRAVLNVLGLYADGWRGSEEIDVLVASVKMLERIEAKSTSAIQETVSQLAAPKTSKKALRMATTVTELSPEGAEEAKKIWADSKPTKGERLHKKLKKQFPPEPTEQVHFPEQKDSAE